MPSRRGRNRPCASCSRSRRSRAIAWSWSSRRRPSWAWPKCGRWSPPGPTPPRGPRSRELARSGGRRSPAEPRSNVAGPSFRPSPPRRPWMLSRMIKNPTRGGSAGPGMATAEPRLPAVPPRLAAEPPPLPPAVWAVVPLVFGSGLCALVYQTAWQREFRLIFGASTAASAAVVAVFMGGLGLGGLLLGSRADRQANPLRFYAVLEALVALTAITTPALLDLARRIYLSSGGTVVLGQRGGTAIRLLLAGLVLSAPTFIAGGTLGAAARAVEHAGDRRRRTTAMLYGWNTLGAVVGCLAATFWLFESGGTLLTVRLAPTPTLLVAAR